MKKSWMCLSNFVNLTRDIQDRQYKDYAPIMEGINMVDELRMLEADKGPIPVTEACSTREALEHIQGEFKLDSLQLSAYDPDKACAVGVSELSDHYKTECAIMIPEMSSPIELMVYYEPKFPKLIKKMTTNSEIITDEMQRWGYQKSHERSVEVEGHKIWTMLIFCPIKKEIIKKMENKPTILWIHGFGGCPNNVHVVEMRKRYHEYEWYSIEVDHHAKASMEKINAYIREHEIRLVAGTSLGGYYAMCAEFDGPKLVVNPVTDPIRDLRQFVGKCSYKPGRPDGQTEFEFTEDMLLEFGELRHDKQYHTICHYTAHDQLLGEGIKQEYQRIFYFLEMMDEKILPEHFMTFRYIRAMKNTLRRLIDGNSMRFANPYNDLVAYQLLPQDIVSSLTILHSWNGNINYKKVLREIEGCIKEVYDADKRLIHEPWLRNALKTKATLKTLLHERNFALKKLFVLTKDTFDEFKSINGHLLDMYNRMVDKMAKLYSTWLADEEDGWQNDCNVCGTITVEGIKDDYVADDSGSDYEWMMERIEELDESRILTNEFSGAPDIECDRYQLNLEHDDPNTFFCLRGAEQYGDFLMCRAFRILSFDSLYAPQDIMRIKHYWCDVYLTHQRIINDKGELQ